MLNNIFSFIKQKEYWARPPKPLSHVFAIDVSWNAIKSGMLAKCVDSIRDILFNSPNSIPPGGKVGIITFDKDVHFYNLQVFIYTSYFFKNLY